MYERHPLIKEEVERCRAELLSASSSSIKDFRAQLRSSANILSYSLLSSQSLTPLATETGSTAAPSSPLSVGKVSSDEPSLWADVSHLFNLCLLTFASLGGHWMGACVNFVKPPHLNGVLVHQD